MVCEGLNNCKLGVSKQKGNQYIFDYVKPECTSDNYKNSANKRPKVSDHERKKRNNEATKKWQQKEYKRVRCDKY